MKTPHRPFLGILLLLGAFFLAASPACGALGWALHRGTSWLLGQAGTTLLGVGLLLSGVLLIVPLQAWIQFIKWGFKHPAAARPVIHEKSGKVIPLNPVDRMRLDDARGALKNLGYRPNEIDPLVAQMDPALPLEQLVKVALQQLQKRAVAS